MIYAHHNLSGVYTHPPIVMDERGKELTAHRSSETMMRTPGGWYTFLGGSWCWVHYVRSTHSKNRWVYYAVIPGRREPTPRVKNLHALETIIAAIPAAEKEKGEETI
jgi:hypothetical protein